MLNEYLYFVGNLLSYIVGIGIILYSIIAFIEYYRDSKSRKNIKILQAKISMLRMMLKAKVRNRSNKIHKSQVEDGSIFQKIKSKYEQMMLLDFTKSVDFNTYIDLSYEALVDVETSLKKGVDSNDINSDQKKGSLEYNLAMEKWIKLLKNDKKGVIVVFEIVQSTNQLNAIIDFYNQSQKKVKRRFAKTEDLKIKDFEILQDLMNDQQAKADLLGQGTENLELMPDPAKAG